MAGHQSVRVLNRLARLPLLTSNHPQRVELAQLVPDEPPVLKGTIAVWRNHAIEPLEKFLLLYLNQSGLKVDLLPGGYDDSLSLAPAQRPLLHLIWFDLDRISLEEEKLRAWFIERIAQITSNSTEPVVVVPISKSVAHAEAVLSQSDDVPGAHFADPWSLCSEAGLDLIDERLSALAGTRVSRDAQIHLARAMGTHWLPAALLPSKKMVAVDLDETLHRGVLGEDGISGVVITPAHRRLHEHLKTLKAEGVLLSLISRNEPEDVEELFAQRQHEYGISLGDFSTVEVSWGPKPAAIQRAADALRVSENAVVFVDDNVGELLSVGSECPSVAVIRADEDPDKTTAALKWQSGLWRWSRDSVAEIRAEDLAANVHRGRLLQNSPGVDGYLEGLGVTIEITIDDEEQVARLADLSRKTNQFNLTTARLSEGHLRRVIGDPNSHVVGVRLSDRLSESGVIALLSARQVRDQLMVEELLMSCRAMGRGLENFILTQALCSMPSWQEVHEVVFTVQETHRNAPARRWLADFVELPTQEASAGVLCVPARLFDEFTVPETVTITVRRAGEKHP